jgi:hypothetical protein
MSLLINKILRANPRSCKYGAPMGSRSIADSETSLHLQRVHFVDGDYGPDGTYWGSGGGPLYCAFNGSDCPEYAPAMGSRIYVRARSRDLALAAVLEEYPDVTFKRGR